MATLITDPGLERRLQSQRKERGLDQFDEVWDGVYVMAPIANDEHQQIQTVLTTILQLTVGFPGIADVRGGGVNISDRDDDWERNYRVPDIAVFLKQTAAINRGTYWRGGPDLAIEVISTGDKTRDKLEFYAKVNTRELLIIDRDPWRLELHRLTDNNLVEVARSELPTSTPLTTQTVPLTFRLIPGPARPQIEVAHAPSNKLWTI